MRYVVKDEVIEEKPLMPFKINWTNNFLFLLLWLPGILFTTYACMNGWDTYNPATDEWEANWSGILAGMFLVFGGVSTVPFLLGAQRLLWTAIKPEQYYVYNLLTKYMHLEHYKEAVDDLIVAIKSKAYEKDDWRDVFSELNKEARRFERKQKQLLLTITPRKDYAANLKDFNDAYFGDERS